MNAQRKKSQAFCDKWNSAHAIGSAVKYHHIIGEPEFTEHATRTEAYVCDAGYPVIFLHGVSGFVALEAVEV